MVTTKKSLIDEQKILNAVKACQYRKAPKDEGIKGLQNNQKTINKMEISPYFLTTATNIS